MKTPFCTNTSVYLVLVLGDLTYSTIGFWVINLLYQMNYTDSCGPLFYYIIFLYSLLYLVKSGHLKFRYFFSLNNWKQIYGLFLSYQFTFDSLNILNRFDGVMDSVLAWRMVVQEFDSLSSQTKDYYIGTCCFSGRQAALMSNNKVESGCLEWKDLSYL